MPARSPRWSSRSSSLTPANRPRMDRIRQAETAKDPAFARNTVFGPKAATSTPPRTGPARNPTFIPMPTVPFAQDSSSRPARFGTAALAAPPKGEPSSADRNASSSRWPGDRAKASPAKQIPPATSEHIITSLRSKRSPSEPATGPASPKVPKVSSRATETSPGDLVRWYRTNSSAVNAASVPARETRRATASRRMAERGEVGVPFWEV